MYDGGKMDGADLISCSPPTACPPNAHPNPQFMYVTPSDVTPYFAMAEQYTFGDRMFQTNEGPSFPAHQFIFGGTSAPSATSTLFAAENFSVGGVSGCLAPVGTTVTLINAEGSETAQPGEYPCYERQTLSDLLDAQKISRDITRPPPVISGPPPTPFSTSANHRLPTARSSATAQTGPVAW